VVPVLCQLSTRVSCLRQLAERLSVVNDEYKMLKDKLDGVRESLIREIAGEDPDDRTCKFDHVSLKQLVRLKFQRPGLMQGRVSFATTLALRVDQARASSATSTERPPASGKEDSYADDGFDGDAAASARDVAPSDGKDDTAAALSPAAHITQSEQRIKQLRAYAVDCLPFV
jgi:hypothetical protein